MKKTVSFSLEEETIDFLDSLKNKYNVATRSAALEKFILNAKDDSEKITDKSIIKNLIKEVLAEMDVKPKNNKSEIKQKEEKIELDSDVLLMSIASSFENMKDSSSKE